MTSLWRRLGATTALTVVAALGLAACGDDDTTADTGDQSEQAGDEGDDNGDTDTLLRQMIAAQQKAGSSRIDMTMSVGGTEITATGHSVIAKDPSDSAMTMTMNVPGSGDMEMRLVDEVFYMNMGVLTEGKFVVVDLEEGPFAEQFGTMLEQMDPARQFALFEEALVEIVQDGEPETIDGVEATPYVLTLDTEVVMDASGITDEVPGVELPETLEYTIFVGDDNLPRRMVMDVLGTQTTMEMSEWGDDVTVTAPGPEEITDIDPFAAPSAAA